VVSFALANETAFGLFGAPNDLALDVSIAAENSMVCPGTRLA
jgi:hypothetical protein